MSTPSPKTPSRRHAMRSLVLGGILPVVAYTIVEEYFGTLWGLVAGMALGVGEIVSEKITQKKVDPITWVGNGILLVMGAISLFTNQGIWFKLQPAIIEAATSALLLGSVAMKKPFLTLLARKQNLFQQVPPGMEPIFTNAFKNFTLRLGLFFLIHCVLATWAAFAWSTRAWAILKGVGFTGTLILYMLIESLTLRRLILKKAREEFIRRSSEIPAKSHSPENPAP